MNDITARALIAKIKEQTESFDTVVLKEVEAKALVGALEKREELRASANRVVNQQDIELQELRQRNAELVEALEKAQQKIVELQQGCENDPRIHEIIDLKEHVIETNDVLCNLLPDCRYMDPPDGGSVTPLEQVSRMVADYRQRIAELESRTVTVKLPTGYVVRPGHPINEGERGVMIPKDGGAWLSRFDVEHMLKVAGIQVIEGEG